MDGKTLITGSKGQLGRALEGACRHRGIEFEGRDIDTLDICDAEAVTGWIESAHPRAVINCAAHTAVDDGEHQEDLAFQVNGEAVGVMARACDAAQARLIQISTDYVFSGDANTPYLETDPVSPATAYGRTKLRGEELAATAADHLIVRTAWLYGHGGRNFVEAIRRQIEGGSKSLQVVSDQVGTPTFCDDLADAILDLIGVGADGLVHAVNSGITSWHGFAVEIARGLGSSVPIEEVTSDQFPRAARRPAYSALDTGRLESLIGRTMPPWQDALERYLART